MPELGDGEGWRGPFAGIEERVSSFKKIVHFTLYGVTKRVTQVTNLVTHEESLTVRFGARGVRLGFPTEAVSMQSTG
jgi:hypothetical protein